jgi:hypothetical protein
MCTIHGVSRGRLRVEMAARSPRKGLLTRCSRIFQPGPPQACARDIRSRAAVRNRSWPQDIQNEHLDARPCGRLALTDRQRTSWPDAADDREGDGLARSLHLYRASLAGRVRRRLARGAGRRVEGARLPQGLRPHDPATGSGRRRRRRATRAAARRRSPRHRSARRPPSLRTACPRDR